MNVNFNLGVLVISMGQQKNIDCTICTSSLSIAYKNTTQLLSDYEYMYSLVDIMGQVSSDMVSICQEDPNYCETKNKKLKPTIKKLRQLINYTRNYNSLLN